MSKSKTIIDEWTVKDPEGGSSPSIGLTGCTDLGNGAKPGLRVCFAGNVVNYEPPALIFKNVLKSPHSRHPHTTTTPKKAA